MASPLSRWPNATGMFQDEKIAPALKKAVDLILSAQKAQLARSLAIHARTAPMQTAQFPAVRLSLFTRPGMPASQSPDTAFAKAAKYMAKCRGSDGGFGYTSGIGDKPTLTAIGLLCEALGKKHGTKTFKASTKYLSKKLNFRDRYYPYYFEYYMSQALFHADENVWNEWNSKNIRYLSTIQSPNGSFPGNKGQAFSTAGALLSLALNYRFLPIYEK
jgi:hypothetical protein